MVSMVPVLLGCSNDIGLDVFSSSALISIVAPDGGSHLVSGHTTAFEAQVGWDGDVTDLVVTWYSNLDGEITPEAVTWDGNLASFVRPEGLTVGDHQVAARVFTPGFPLPETDTVGVTVVANTPPVGVFVDAPADGAVLDRALGAAFVVEVSDPDQSPDTLDLTWTLDGDEIVGAPTHTVAGRAELRFDTLPTGHLCVGVTTTDLTGAASSLQRCFEAVERDADGDGFATTALGGDDCDDTDPAVNPETVWHLDQDGDGWTAVVALGCEGPAGATTTGTVPHDCDDADDTIFPNAEERCNNLDDDCTGYPAVFEMDMDYDGFMECEECDDTDPTVNPGQTEVCDALDRDEDCNGLADDEDPGVTGTVAWYADADADGHGDVQAAPTSACDGGLGVAVGDDCDDGNNGVFPGAAEVCDGIDDDCDGSKAGEVDLDLDTYLACAECDDTDPAVNPGQTEVCDALDRDEDCSGAADDLDPDVSPSGMQPWYVDADGDTFGDAESAPTYACDAPGGSTSDGTDCDDTDAAVFLGAPETCNLHDDDCDRLVDEDDPDLGAPGGLWDGDGDGWSAWVDLVCWPSASPAGDCDDEDGQVHPGAEEIPCNDTDDDCDATTPDCRFEGDVVAADVADATLTGDPDDMLGSAIDAMVGGSGPVLAVGAPGHDNGQGRVGLWFGEIESGDLATGDFAWIEADEAGKFGSAVALGDVDGDGAADLVAAAPVTDYGGINQSGAVRVFHDVAALVASGPVVAGDATVTIGGTTDGQRVGTALEVGDLNCDGVDDLVVSAPDDRNLDDGEVWVFLGPLPSGTSSPEPQILIRGVEEDDESRIGSAVTLTHEEGEPCTGLLVGAHRTGPFGTRGSAYWFEPGRWEHLDSSSSPEETDVHTAALTVSADLEGELGSAVAAGDFDGDGELDLVFGAPSFNDAGTGGASEGRAYLALAAPLSGSGAGHVLDGATAPPFPLVTWVNEAADGYAGAALASVGDVDGDGIDDLLVGAPKDGDTDAGAAFLYYGGASLSSGTLQATAAAAFHGANDSVVGADNLGAALAGLGDVNADGVDDFAVGAPGVTGDAGALYILFGTNGR